MRHNRKLAGLLLLLVIGAIALVTWCRHDRTGDVTASMPANSGASPPVATPAGPAAEEAEPTHAAPAVESPAGGALETASGEASKPVRVDVADATRGGAHRRASRTLKAKRQEAEPQTSALAAQGKGESSDRADTASPPQATAEAVPPPRETGLLIGRIHNSVGSTFRLTKVSFLVDGAQVAAQDFPNGLERNADVPIFERRVDVGDHNLQVVVEYRGNGGGVFSYFDGYGYKVSSSRELASTANTTTQVTVVSYEKGGVLTSFENRLGVAFRVAAAGSP